MGNICAVAQCVAGCCVIATASFAPHDYMIEQLVITLFVTFNTSDPCWINACAHCRFFPPSNSPTALMTRLALTCSVCFSTAMQFVIQAYMKHLGVKVKESRGFEPKPKLINLLPKIKVRPRTHLSCLLHTLFKINKKFMSWFLPRAEDYKTREGWRRGGEAEKVPLPDNAQP